MKINICMCSMASFMVARFQGRCHAHFNWTLFNDGIEIILWFLYFSNKSRLSKFFVCNIVTFSDSRREFIFSIPSFVTPFISLKPIIVSWGSNVQSVSRWDRPFQFQDRSLYDSGTGSDSGQTFLWCISYQIRFISELCTR